MADILISLVPALAAILVGYEARRVLMMLQQNSYRNNRYRHWLAESKDTTTGIRLTALIVLFITLATPSFHYSANVLIALLSCYISYKLAKARYKKPLAWTARAKRIYATTLILAVAIVLAALMLIPAARGVETIQTASIAIFACYCGSHILIQAANIILKPVESAINRHYYNDAAKRLASMTDLKIVGITGSYGKTSTKHYLHRILSEQFDTLMTPGSYNTTLGVIRTVREYMKPYNEVFIVEMGAKSPGDIKEICDLVHPTMGIITAVGPQHLESFKTIENVQATKFELADALPEDGMIIINNDFEKIADREVENTGCARYAVSNSHADYKAIDVKYTSAGTTFTITGPDGLQLPISTRLMGECNVSDLLAAAVCALKLGVAPEKIANAIRTIEPVEHRLSVKKTAAGITILDDAFNSNPVGSRMALEVLKAMGPGKRIVITPGMIELGQQQFELNKAFGRTIAECVDVAIVVGQYNRDAITEGIEAGKGKATVHTVDSFTEAQQLLATFVSAGDVILYENDLPDTFK